MTPTRPDADVDGLPQLVLRDEERQALAELVAALLLRAIAVTRADNALVDIEEREP